ncbi:hypothetical protein P0W64_16080 [Tsukamurella sp. 8F]|uniref:hypothetical protein n=1 Tax=unclassified Tsukamurella TaxID=2633480 RepID=UPI0023B8AAA9|nr:MULTISPECIES: hypothetical protein [unclassified Tsukamurella]MDF0530974.1 hypothetical protein [Tsukamurella sp. 8J]MDF0588299.1 hypothetical protein [Tsukamurella sp. 8F]
MYILFFALAVLCAAGAAALVWYERTHEPDVHRARADWAAQREFVFDRADPALAKRWHRGGMNVPGDAEVVDVAHGTYFGAPAYVFDVRDAVTVVAVARDGASGVLLDLRAPDVEAPREPGMDPLGTVGPRVLYTNNADVARRVCDPRLVRLAEQVPAHIESLWNEGAWALAALPLTEIDADIDEALEAARQFRDLLRVLPPEGRGRAVPPTPRDPGQPLPSRASGSVSRSVR